jgi:hypothetical protein
METFNSVILWLSAEGGAVILVAWLASWLLDDWHTWNTLSAKWKKIIILVLSAALGVGAKLLILRPELITGLAPYLDSIVLVICAWLTTQVAHKADVKLAK